ncbi:MAG: hypothetical protein ACR2JB_25185 [Bryobacteraceae bacterium]
MPGQRTFDEPSVSDRSFHPHLSVEQRTALVLATRPELIETPVPRVAENRLKAVWLIAAVFLTAASATFAVAYLRARRSAMVSVPRIIQEVPVRSAGLGMRAQAQGDALLLSWNGKNSALQSASNGLLQIDDGSEHREIALDRGGIASASVVYRPVSNDVLFRLELRGSDGLRAAESLEVVGTRTRAGDFEAQRLPDTRNAGKSLSEGTVADQPGSKENGSKEVNTADAGFQTVTRATPKLGRTEVAAVRPSSRPAVAMQKPPSFSMSSVSAGQPSSLSGQELPKPPPEPSSAFGQTAPRHGINTAAAPGNTAGQPAGVQTMGYVPPRPIKWAAPSAKSLGASRISAPTDFEIKVRIDESGRVTAAHALLDRTRHDETVSAAVTAAVKQWIFEPAKIQGKNVASEQTIVIRVDPRN